LFKELKKNSNLKFILHNLIFCNCSVGQKVPPNAKEIADKHFEDVKVKMEKGPHVLANMDETPIWFDVPSNSTLDFKGIIIK
jgi:hypothetical protein